VVPLATVKGIVAGGAATVQLIPDEGSGGPTLGGPGAFAALAGRGGVGRGGPGMCGGAMRAATRADGSFSIPNVTPGKYTIVARADGGPLGSSRTAVQQIIVAGDEVNVALTPSPGVQLS